MKIQFLQVNDLFDKDLFLEAIIYQKKECLFFVVQLLINIMRIFSVQVAVIIP